MHAIIYYSFFCFTDWGFWCPLSRRGCHCSLMTLIWIATGRGVASGNSAPRVGAEESEGGRPPGSGVLVSV